jgi:hypothetical protein
LFAWVLYCFVFVFKTGSGHQTHNPLASVSWALGL